MARKRKTFTPRKGGSETLPAPASRKRKQTTKPVTSRHDTEQPGEDNSNADNA